jgi:16S rRNA (adenine1518-N6/adenine1519-N6)-dimethyltransferase
MVAAPRLKKRHGQHHLRHSGLCRPLVDFLRPSNQRVLEIGPGGGVLTGELIRAGGRVWAWEVDPEWALRLHQRSPGRELSLVIGDALEIQWSRLPAGTLVAGNLPYAIATRLIRNLLVAARGVDRAGFLVQAEVGSRLTAVAGDSDYGALSVLVRAHAETHHLGRVRRASFRPPPKVDGAFVGLRRREPVVPSSQWTAFEAMVRQAFAQRRKTLRNALAARWGRQAVDRLLRGLGLPAQTRATEMSLEQLVRVFRECRRLDLS